MSANIAQIFTANPLTTLGDNDLIYVGQNGTTDGAINYSNLTAVIGWMPAQGSGIGSYQGFNAAASGNFSLAACTSNTVGDYSVAFGNSCVTAGTGSFAAGNSCVTGSDYCFAFGNGCSASGSYSFALGHSCIALNQGSVVWGDSTGAGNSDSTTNQFNLTFSGGYRFFGGTFNVSTVGSGLAVAEGSNAKQGTATLSSGTVVVSNTSVTTSSRIFLTAQDNNSTGSLRASARTAGTSFTITSSNSGDSGVVAYQIFEPAI